MDEETPADEYRTPPRSKLSSTPSWVMLGFILGALFVYLLPSGVRNAQPPKGPPPQQAPQKPKPAPIQPARLTDIEAVFAVWGRYAVWDENRTEVAMWNSERRAYADFYEVLQDGDHLYFRTITRLTRPLLANAKHPECPLVFTETAEMRREWLRNRSELVPAYPAPDANPEAPAPEQPGDGEPAKKP